MATSSSTIQRQHHAFRKNLKILETAITDPGGLATSLYGKGLIDRLAKQRAHSQSATILERNRELLDKLEARIENDVTAFDTFLHILDSDPTMEDICRMLRADRGI